MWENLPWYHSNKYIEFGDIIPPLTWLKVQSARVIGYVGVNIVE